MTPAKAIEQLRRDGARCTGGTGRSVRFIAHVCGFGNAERMRRTFVRLFGAPPSALDPSRALTRVAIRGSYIRVMTATNTAYNAPRRTSHRALSSVL